MTLTREEIQGMQPGRELDAKVAELVMGLDMVEGQLPQLPRYFLSDYEKTIHRDVPLYSSDISAAWEVVEKFNFVQVEYVEWFAGNKSTNVKIGVQTSETEFKESEVTGKTAPEAICKAALLAVLNL